MDGKQEITGQQQVQMYKKNIFILRNPAKIALLRRPLQRKQTDALATEAIRSIRETGELSSGKSTHEHFNLKDLYGLKWLRTFADGGLRDHISSSAWVVEGASERREDGSPDWRILCTGTAWNGDRTSMYAEIYATVEGLQATLRIVKLAFDL